ncbi:hypothetical protein DAETH_04720 [Deinococcus aetherius]|uniref:Uncharacterized protein n=1 Tax=Deinococcus aetherius TaxID=200252 RepID=A0ABM8AA22_9DEIO|nr:hypothetical protein DAETH_04720 [Deinococcus aetherius]
MAQERQAGIARAEVVERDPHAQLTDARELPGGVPEVDEQAAPGDFEFERTSPGTSASRRAASPTKGSASQGCVV